MPGAAKRRAGSACVIVGVMTPLSVSMLPSFVEPESLSGQVVVVIDVLRASTTILHALANGARSVIACESVEEARSIAAQSRPGSFLLGGERHCTRIDGFDLDNSPLSYESSAVADLDIIFTTTNGTYALNRSRSAARILVGAFNNLEALVRVLIADGRPVHLVCAGTDRQLTAEDILLAGAILDRLLALESDRWTLADVQATMAHDFFRARSRDAASLRRAVFESLGARNLIALGMERDIDRAIEFNRFSLVPEWNVDTRQIRLSDRLPSDA